MSGSKKRKIFSVISFIILLTVSICMLAACNDETDQTLKTYSVFFDMNDNSAITVEKTMTITEISKFSPENDREGYIFSGWAFDKNGNSPFNERDMENGITLYAVWTAKQYSVSFLDANGDLILKRMVEYGKSATPPTDSDIQSFVPADCKFVGWDKSFDNVKSDLTVTMIIAKSTEVFTVRFMDGEDLIQSFQGESGNGIPQSISIPQKSGFKFDKWQTSEGKIFTSDSVFSADETYYAIYSIKTPTTPIVTGANVEYGEDIRLAFSGEQEISPLSYEYEWLDADSNKLADGREFIMSSPNAGSYGFKLKVTVSCPGYESVYAVTALKTITVSKTTLTASVSDQSIVYGQDFPSVWDISYSGFVNGDDESVIDSEEIQFLCQYQKGCNVGVWTVSVIGLTADNYEIVGENGGISANLNVLRKQINLQKHFSAQYINSPIEKEFENLSIDDLVFDHVLDLTLKTTGYTVGEYSTQQNSVSYTVVILNGNGENVSANYAVSVDATVTITPADITFDLPQQTTFEYDANSHSATVVNIASNISVFYSTDGVNYSSEIPAFTNAGIYTVYTKMSADNYNDANARYDVTITPASITIGAKSQTTVYGQNFSLDSRAWEILSGNTYNNIFSISLSTDYKTGNPVGVYEIGISVQPNDNFVISTRNATLTVDKAQLEATVENICVTYGDEFVPTLNLVSVDGLYGDDDAMLTLSTTYSPLTSNVYTPEIITCQSANTNYNLTLTEGIITVVKRDIIIKTNDSAVVYGDAFTSFEHYLAGGTLANNDTYTATAICQYAQGSPAGIYPIGANVTVLNGETDKSENYNIIVNSGDLTVAKRNLSVNIENQNVVYGEISGDFSYTVYGDPAIYDTVKVVFDCDHTPDKNIGNYTITASVQVICNETDNTSNYNITLNNGVLTVSKRNVSFSIRDMNVVYGDNLGAFECEITSGNLSGNDSYYFNYTCAYYAGTDVGTYVISGGVSVFDGSIDKSANYDINVSDGVLTVSTRTIELSADDTALIYGEAFYTDSHPYTISGGVFESDELVVLTDCAYTQGSDVGNYEISLSAAIYRNGRNQTGNYDITLHKGTLSVIKRSIQIKHTVLKAYNGEYARLVLTMQMIEGAYGNDVFAGELRTVSAENGVYSSIDKDFVWESALEANNGAGKDVLGNYEISYEITVTIAVDSIGHIASSYSGIYDGEPHSGSVSVTEDVDYSISYSTDNVSFDLQNPSFVNSGEYTVYFIITATDMTPTKGEFNVVISKKEITLYIDAVVTYGEPFAPTLNMASNGALSEFDVSSLSLSVNCQYLQNDDAGTYPITYSYIENSNYVVNTIDSVLTVKPKSVNVVFESDHTIEYGDSFVLPSFTVSDENAREFISLSTDYKPGDSTGTYALTAVCSNANYTLNSTNGSVRVVAKQVNVSVEDVHVSYGDSLILPSFECDNDSAKQYISLTSNYKTGDDAGEYTLDFVCSNQNFALVKTTAKVIVDKRTVTVIADSITATYGDEINPTYTVDNVYNNYIVENVTLSFDSSAAGIHTIYVFVADENPNYNFVSQNGVLTINKATLNANLNGIFQITYGQAFPSYTISYDGFVNGDNENVIIGEAKISCEYENAKAAGSYEIFVTDASADNYELVFSCPTLIVNKAQLVLTLDYVQTITYGEEMPIVGIASYEGFVNGDDQSVLEGEFVAVCAYAESPSAGLFSIQASGLNAQNYVITVNNATLNVEKALLTVTVKDHAAITYGDPVPTDFDCDITGFVFNDASDINTFKASIVYATTYKQGSNASAQGYDYNADVSQTIFENYDLAVGQPKQLVVNKADYAEGEIVHEPLQIMYSPDNKLNRLSLTQGFAWADPSTSVGETGTRAFPAIYSGDINHNACSISVSVIVTKSTDVTITNNDLLEADWTADGAQLQSLINANSTNPEDTSVVYNILTAAIAKNDVSKITDGGIYTIQLVSKETANYVSVTKTVTVKIKAASINGVLYTVEDALAQGGNITLTGNAFISSNVEVKSGSVLILPSSADSSTTIGSPTYGAGSKTYVDTNANYIEHVLTVHQGVTITVNGTILINGLLGAEGGIREGHTSGAHSQIVNNGTLDFANGSEFDVRGYVKGNGIAYFRSGSTVYSPFVVLDFRGGTNTVTVYRKGSISPFNQYELPNIQCESYTYSNATHKVYLDLYASSQHNTSVSEMYGSSGVLQIASGGYIHKLYNRTTQKTTLTFVGNVTMGSLSLKVQSVTAKMSDVMFPIPWTMNLIIGDGSVSSSLTASYQYKLMTGASFTVNKNATLNLSGKAIVYGAFKDTTFGGAVYPDKDEAQFIVNGTLNVTGSFAGKITAKTNGAKAIFASGASTSLSSVEGNSGDTSSAAALLGIGMKFVTVATVSETAAMVNADGSTATPNAGTTYTYNAGTGIWA